MPSMMENVDLIVGMDHLEAFGAVLDCKNGTVKLTDPRLAQEFRPKERLPPGKVNPHNVVSAMLTLQKAAPTEFLSPHQTAKSIRQGDSSWLMLVQPSVAETQDVVATCAEASILESAPRLLSHQAIGKVTEEFKDVFEPIPECPPHRFEVDHTIKLVDGSAPTFRRPFKLSKQEEEEVHKQVEDALKKGLIEPSVSLYGAPVLFVQKKDGSLRMCIDYLALNKITVRDRYPLLRTDDLLDKLHGCKKISSLDLQSGYHQIRLRDEDKP
jgi:hypothetical protein